MRHLTLFLIAGSLLKLFGCSGHENKSILTSEMLSGIKDNELEQMVFEDISTMIEADRRGERQILKSLTAGQRAICVTSIVEGEVNNGGFNQFYFNSRDDLLTWEKNHSRQLGQPNTLNL